MAKNILESETKIRWISKSFDFFKNGNKVKTGDIGEISSHDVKNQYLVKFIGSNDETIRIYATLDRNFRTLKPKI